MHLLNAWKESLSILKPANLKLFLLVTLKSILYVYELMFKKFWSLLLILIIAGVAVEIVIRVYTAPFTNLGDYIGWISGGTAASEQTTLQIPLLLLLNTLWLLFAACFAKCFIYLLARPSVHLKDYRYIFSYAKRFMYIFFYNLFFIILSILCAVLALELINWVFLNKTILSLVDKAMVAAASLWGFFILFIFDSDGTVLSSIKSLWRAIKMWMLNFPVCIILSCIAVYGSRFILFFVQSIIMLLGNWLFGIEHIAATSSDQFYFVYFFKVVDAFIIAPIFVCLITNFYFKQLHEKFNEYYHTNS